MATILSKYVLPIAALIVFGTHQTAFSTVVGLLDSGAILNQIQTPPALPSPPNNPMMLMDQEAIDIPPAGQSFALKRIQITGHNDADYAILHALVADAEGKNLSLAQLHQLAFRITVYYRKKGYPLMQAIIRPQVIRAGVVQITVVMARYGNVTLNNRSEVRNDLLQATLSSVNKGQDIAQAELDRALLLLTDIPGVAVTATLKAGDKVDTSDLLVSTSTLPRFLGNTAVDNFGNSYTGQGRVGINLSVINPLNLRTGDSLTLDGLTSNQQMRYGRLAYDSLLNGQGSRLGGAYSMLNYRLATPLQANGTAQMSSLWLKQPLIRRKVNNLYGMLQHDSLKLRDHIDSQAIKTDRHLSNWTLSMVGDARDELLSGGSNSWALGWTQGRVGFDDASAQLANAATVNTQGSFSKWTASLTRSQRISSETSLYLAASGQRASSNLDSSQKMTLGGPFAVRAYDSGAVTGDNGQLVTVEFRHALGQPWGGQLTGMAFADSAHVTVNKTLWHGTTGPNSALLSGVGLGVQWSGPQQWTARAYMAAPVGASSVLTGRNPSARVWLETRKGF